MRRTRVRTPGPGRPTFFVDPLVALLALALLSLSCKTGLRLGPDGRFEHREYGYSIADPAAHGANWQPVEVERAELAYTDRRGGSMSMLRECRGSAQPSLLARQLRIGLERLNDSVLEAHPVALHGDPGWSQTFVVIEGSDEVLVRSVTLVAGRCTYDWVLVGAGDPGREVAFDRWWKSFRPASLGGDASASRGRP